jgi:hypothetical protein
VPSEAPVSPETASSAPPATLAEDIRRSRLYVLSRGPLVGLLRRAVSVAALVIADVAGLALGVYVALVLRAIVYGDTIYWSLLWDTGPAEWLPFLAPITVLVFLRSGLYASGRAGSSPPSCSSR